MNALVLAFFAVVAVVAAAPASPPAPPPPQPPSSKEPIAIISQQSEVNPDGSYISKFESADGISVSEEGSTKIVDKDTVVQVAKGKSAYTAPDGTLIETEWFADDTGYHASGAHLPVAPETPAYIAKSLEWSAAHPYEEKDEIEAKKL